MNPTKYKITSDLQSQLKHAVFAVHKNKDVTSAQTLDLIKRVIVKDAGKRGHINLMVGHGGVLDHTARGVLGKTHEFAVVGMFWGCKLLTHMLKGDKEYLFTAKLGQATTTYNEVGEITDESDYSGVTQQDIRTACEKFVGTIYQTPPIYSALKYKGSRLSDLAKAGTPVVPNPRLVVCHELSLLDFSPPFFTARARTGGGFYIRSLANDIGKDLGTHAHVTELVREAQIPFALDDCLSMDDLTLSNILDAIKLTGERYGDILKEAKKIKEHQRLTTIAK